MSTYDYKTMTTAEIRAAFLRFFEEKGCKAYPSSSLVPDDPSLLLTNAGMNQFKEYYQGLKTMPEIGACSCQKCLRTNDIDNIGDSRHLSFFEMLGNFSFGGYSKADAIAWAWDFCTSDEHLGLPAERLHFTVYTDDDEAARLWCRVGADPTHITRLGEDDNFWAAGPTGPCGPCSEIYFDQGEEFGCGRPDCAPGCDCDRYLEFWNLVFTQYDRQEDGSLPELPHKNVDTGMGLERIAAIMQHEHSNYEGDVLMGLISVGEQLSGARYREQEATDRSLRILADHSRAVTFMIGDGILPGNEGRGYVLRRLLRRAVYHGRLLGIDGIFLARYAEEVMRLMAGVYPELAENRALILGILGAEEERFNATLDAGEAHLAGALAELGEKDELSGKIAFKLHDTYGFPIDLTREICAAAGHDVGMSAFDACMAEQRERGRSGANRDAWSSFSDVWVALSATLAPSEFCGYDADALDGATVLALVRDNATVTSAGVGERVSVVLDRTPFYAEMGGQVGDTGKIVGANAAGSVSDTVHHEGGLVAHVTDITAGVLHVGDVVTAAIDHGRRELIRRNHTATHLLDAALKRVLGEHVSQAGSRVAPDRLRFDFTHFEALSKDELDRIEGLVNAEICAAVPVLTRVMSLDEAKAIGAIALFGEKYGETVRVVATGEAAPFSMELCGGTHVRNTSELGFFKIVSESSVGSNARRIEAVTSAGAVEYVDSRLAVLAEAASLLKCRSVDVVERLAAVLHERNEAQRKLKSALAGGGSNALADAVAAAVDLGAYRLVVARLDGLDGKAIRSAWDTVRERLGDACACVLASATGDGKVALLAAGTNAAVSAGFDAGMLIRQAAKHIGGRGGGKPTMAQAGGSQADGIPDALDAVRTLLGA